MSYDTAFPMTGQDGMEGFKLKQPWMTYGLLKSCKKKTKLYVNYLKTPNLTNKIKFTKYRNKFKTVRIKAEKLYYEKEFIKHNQNI